MTSINNCTVWLHSKDIYHEKYLVFVELKALVRVFVNLVSIKWLFSTWTALGTTGYPAVR